MDGFALVSGRPGMCLAANGPGAMNLVMGVATAYKDSSPVVAITGQEISVETLAGRFSWQGLGEEDHSGMV